MVSCWCVIWQVLMLKSCVRLTRRISDANPKATHTQTGSKTAQVTGNALAVVAGSAGMIMSMSATNSLRAAAPEGVHSSAI